MYDTRSTTPKYILPLRQLGDVSLYQTKEQIRKGAITLYGLLHARYIRTENGMQKINAKYKRGVYGICPRVKCEPQATLPMGIFDVPGQSSIKLFCPRCKEVYDSPKQFKKIDSAFFGTVFPQLFLMMYPNVGQDEKKEFAGTIKGFKMHESSLNHPPKVDYNPNKNEYEIIPRPVANFDEDEEHIANLVTARRNFLCIKQRAPNKN